MIKINTVEFEKLGFQYEIDEQDNAYMFSKSVKIGKENLEIIINFYPNDKMYNAYLLKDEHKSMTVSPLMFDLQIHNAIHSVIQSFNWNN
jgi:hypothetical protein